jgi:hypothetical protein
MLAVCVCVGDIYLTICSDNGIFVIHRLGDIYLIMYSDNGIFVIIDFILLFNTGFDVNKKACVYCVRGMNDF